MFQLLEHCKMALKSATETKGHPFRYFSLGTVYRDAPKQRTVVLRKIDSDFTLMFYTDKRSHKVTEIADNSSVSALFYDPKELVQIRIEGIAVLVKDKQELNDYWKTIPKRLQKDYSTQLRPGAVLKDNTEPEFDDTNEHFLAIKIQPITIEYLQLGRSLHSRVLFAKESGKWIKKRLVP